VAELTAIVLAPSADEPARIAALAVECARVGAGAVRLPAGDPQWLEVTAAAVAAACDLEVLMPGAPPAELQLGADPIAELHRALRLHPPEDLVIGGADVTALLAGLAAGTHLRAGSADMPDPSAPDPSAPNPSAPNPSAPRSQRGEVQLVARAAALARLAGRPPMTPDQVRAAFRRPVRE
jgi:hypothetical protein